MADQRVKELERVIAALNKRHELLLIVISEHLAEGKKLTLEEAIVTVRSAGQELDSLREQAKDLKKS
jgi:vacuolar-type H+-ATPase subunit F/Vma7